MQGVPKARPGASMVSSLLKDRSLTMGPMEGAGR